MNFILVFLSVVLAFHAISSELHPAIDAREEFAADFYRRLIYFLDAREKSFVVSPAAVQKLLAVLYELVGEENGDTLLWDMKLKHIDANKLIDDARREGILDIGFSPHLRERQLRKLREKIDFHDVLNYFQHDFIELGNATIVENFFVFVDEIPKAHEIFAKEYFSTIFLTKDSPEVQEIEEQFPNMLNATARFQIFSTVGIDAKLKFGCTKSAGLLTAVGKFKHGSITHGLSTTFKADVLELPLEADLPLSMLLFTTESSNEFFYLLSQVMGRTLSDFNKLFGELKEEDIEVKLPEFQLKQTINLGDYFFENPDAGFSALFGGHGNGYHQKVTVKVIATNAEDKGSNATATNVFDFTNKSFFFVVKSEKVAYFLGHVFNSNFE